MNFFNKILLTAASLFFAVTAYASSVSAIGPIVKIETNKGDITVQLNQDKAPITVENFIKYVKSGFYSGTIFHRVIPGFMIQGGGFTENMEKKPAYYPPIKLEVSKDLKNLRGTIAMARTTVRDSATSQFFINLKDNTNLDTLGGGYAVFGKVIDGMNVVDKIAGVATETKGMYRNVPVTPVVINQVVIVSNDK